MDNSLQLQTLQNGDIGSTLMKHKFDVNCLRPYTDVDGHNYVNNAQAPNGQSLVENAVLRKDEWIHLDTAITQVARFRLNLVDDLKSKGMTYNLANAMGTTVLQYQNMSDIGEASISMSPVNAGDNDRPNFDLTSLPVPIIAKDFFFDVREIETSRNLGQGLDLTNAQQAAVKVAEYIEQLHTGAAGTYAFGGGTIYGLRNFPSRITATVSDWTASAKTNEQRFSDILTLINTMRDNKQYGPYYIYVGNDLEQYLDDDYKAESDLTLRERIMKIGMDRNDGGKVLGVKALDYLTDGDIIILNTGAATRPIEVVQGIDIRTVQWETNGGLLKHFKVMAIMFPRCRADYNGACGILHATQV